MTRTLLSLPEPPSAVFAASDTQAMGVLEAAQDASLTVPGDLSIIGFDDIEVAGYLGLTTMRQQLFESGWEAVHLLLECLDSECVEPVCKVLPPALIDRSTTAPPRQHVAAVERR